MTLSASPRLLLVHVLRSVPQLLHSLHASDELLEALLARSGHLLLFSAWLQHPEPPATQSLPLEDRGFYGVVDSILQLRCARTRCCYMTRYERVSLLINN